MPFTRTDILLGVVVPAALAFAIVVLISKVGKRASVRLAAAPIALVIGFEAGYWSLSLGSVVPESGREWLPYLIAIAAIVTIALHCLGESPTRQTIVLLLLAVVCGLVLTPTWEDLSPPRAVYLICWPLIVTAMGYCGHLKSEADVDAKPKHAVFVIFLGFFATAILLAFAGSLRFAQIGLALSGASAGILTATVFKLYRESPALMMTPVAIALCGSLLIGKVNSFSEVPLISYLLIPAAFTSLCLAGSKTLEGRFGNTKWLISGAFAILVCLTSLGIAAWFEAGNS